MKTQLLLDEATRQLILNAKRRHDAGASFRQIADDLGISKSKAERLCKKWTPQLEEAETGQWPEAVSPYYFPGREEYVEAGRDPRFNDIYDREGEEFALLRREAYMIEAACAKARQEYLKTGKAPTLAEILAKMSAAEAVAAAGGSDDLSVSGAITTGFQDADHTRSIGGEYSAVRTPHSALSTGLRRSLDGYGREIFIEKEGTNGKPDIWYDFDSKGRKLRKVRR